MSNALYSGRKRLVGVASVTVLVATVVVGTLGKASQPWPVWDDSSIAMMQSLSLTSLKKQPVDPSNAFWNDPAAAALGHRLFSDTRLSADKKRACVSCHQPQHAFTDGQSTATGLAPLTRNTPTLIGAAYSRRYNWDGRSDSLWAQATGPLESASELGISRGELMHLLITDRQLREEYEHVFGPLNHNIFQHFNGSPCGPQTNSSTGTQCWQRLPQAAKQSATRVLVGIAKSLAAYQATLKPVTSRFDHFVTQLSKGQVTHARELMSRSEQRGLQLFLDIEKTQCLNCHNGPLLSNGGMHDIGTNLSTQSTVELGQFLGVLLLQNSEFKCDSRYSDALPEQCHELRFLQNRNEGEGRGAFKVPTLRNLVKTAPYMHDGRFHGLSEVLDYYNNPPLPDVPGAHELKPLALTDAQLKDMGAFLQTLSDAD